MVEIKNRKILVTGGAGFIGSYLVSELTKLGNKIIVVDDLSSGKKENIDKKIKLYKTDIRSKKIFEIFKKEKPEIIFHFAARPLVEEAFRNPYEAIEVNVMGTVNVLEACRQQKNIESIIIVSSDKAYGKAKKLPYTENHPLAGAHPYDSSKSSADLLARAYALTYDLPIKITRFSNVYGPGDLNLSRIIPGIMNCILNKKQLLIRSNGKMIREYTHVSDIVRGCIKLGSHKGNYGEAFNFGSKSVFNVIDVVKKAEKALGVKIDYKILNTAKNEIPAQYLNWDKSKKVLNWQPKISFEQGLQETFTWFRNL